MTEQQKAYVWRKLKTRAIRADFNKDGFLSREDFELWGKRLIELTRDVSKKKAKAISQACINLAEMLDIKPGIKVPVGEVARTSYEQVFNPDFYEKRKSFLHCIHNLVFDAIDISNDGYVDEKEFSNFFKVINHEMFDEEIPRSFKAIDSNGDGLISREEFLAAALDFYQGMDETETSNAFFGPLLP